jgi:hypothetical protein
MKDWIISRLKEKSTWAGILGLLSAFGVYQFAPEQKEAVLTAIGAITSAILVFLNENKNASQ